MTRPFSVSTMSGNFDFPPANTGSVSALEEANSILQDAQSHRSALRNRLDEVRRLRDQVNDSDEHRRLRVQQSAVRDEIRRRHTPDQTGRRPSTFPDQPVQAPISSTRPRFGTIRHRSRPSNQGTDTPTVTGGSVQQAVERLNEASSNLSSLLDQPIPRIGSPELGTREYSGEAAVNGRRKRRKTDGDFSATGHMKGFSYGHRGQVVPGRLRMELVICDGGIHREAARSGHEYWPDNVLRNDKSVYCTDNSKCNIILRHLGETTFDLKKLVIKAPERGFTAPIQEGMIFVSMTAHDLLSRTAQYQVRDPSPLRPDSDAKLLWSDDIVDENRPSSRRRDSGAHRPIPPPISNSMPRNSQQNPQIVSTGYDNNQIPYADINDNPTPRQQTTIFTDNLGFNVETTCSDPSSDEEEPSSAATLADLRSRDRLPHDASTDEETEDGLERAMRLRAGRTGISTGPRRSRRRADPRIIEVVWPPSTGTADAGTAKAPDVLPPHAKFFIEREKSVVSIKFDPPVSGKFILLKLWSPAKDQNIDIQSIIAHGFSGPRFFPAAQMM